MDFDKIVIITQKTWLDGLVEQYGSKEQAKFYIEHMGGSFDDYYQAHERYYHSLRTLKQSIPLNQKYQVIEREFLPNFLFNDSDLVVVLGRDGLVVNTAKYLDAQPILALNPDPHRIDGVLIPFGVDTVREQLRLIHDGDQPTIRITLSQASLSTQQRIYGVNDLFIGHQSHQSARYTIKYRGYEESHSSSGIIVSTGVGSTGWFKSIISGALGIANGFYGRTSDPLAEDDYRVPWDADLLHFCVREPWSSKVTGSNIVFGQIHPGEELVVESRMPEGGVIFSDGIERDYLSFSSGTIATVGIADKKATLFVRRDTT